MNKLESIQVLRGLAALFVVLFHYRFYLVPEGSDLSLPDTLFVRGAMGVDLFFVISGFIMVYVTSDKRYGIISSKNFIFNRLTRILPTYYFLLFFAFLTGGALSTFHYPEKISNLISALTFIPYLTQYAPLYIHPDTMFNIRWTLNYELYFYVVFTIALLSKYKNIILGIWLSIPIIIAASTGNNIELSTRGFNYSTTIFNF